MVGFNPRMALLLGSLESIVDFISKVGLKPWPNSAIG